MNPVPYVRTVKTASGATAVQTVYSSHRGSRDIAHIGLVQARLYPFVVTDTTPLADEEDLVAVAGERETLEGFLEYHRRVLSGKLFIAAAQWHGMQAAMSDRPDWTGQLLAVPGQPAPHAGHP